MKTCKECGLPETEVKIESRRRVCNPCRGREYYARNREACRQRARDRYDPAKAAEYHKRYNAENPHKKREWQLRRWYGMTLEDYDKMFAEQDGRCAICRETHERTLHVDHCHTTGRVRKLLCTECNTGLGKFKERPDLLEAAIAYLAA
jgi:hypothetical protein